MTTITLTAPGQPPQVLHCPTRWADISLGLYVQLFAPEPGDQRTPAELLLGLPAGGLNQLAAGDVPLIAGLLDFIERPEEVTSLLPTPGLPDVGGLPYGVLLLCHQHLADNADRGDLASLPYVLAAYRTQLLHGNTDRLEQTLAALLAAPVTGSYGDGAHFLAACRNWQPGRRLTPPTKPTSLMRRLMLILSRVYQKDSVRSWPWTRWLAGT